MGDTAMTTIHTFRGRLSVILAAALFLSFWQPVIPAYATEPPGESTLPTETIAAEETTAITEPSAATEPPTEATEPPPVETVTEPPETTVETLPPETAAPAEEDMAPVLFSEAFQQTVFQRIYSLDALTSGEYVLVNEAGYAPEMLQDQWITAVEPVVEGDTVTDDLGAVWTLTVGAGVMLTDNCGVSVAPSGDGENGITEAEYFWQVSCTGGLFSFHGSNGTEPVTLAGNKSLDGLFRAYRDATVQASPDAYPSTFALYRYPDPGSETVPIPVSTIAQVRAMAEGTEGIAIQGTIVYANGEQVILQDATGGIALSFGAVPQVTP